jgi:hypothetical protein
VIKAVGVHKGTRRSTVAALTSAHCCHLHYIKPLLPTDSNVHGVFPLAFMSVELRIYMKRNYGAINAVIEVFTAKTWRPRTIPPEAIKRKTNMSAVGVLVTKLSRLKWCIHTLT